MRVSLGFISLSVSAAGFLKEDNLFKEGYRAFFLLCVRREMSTMRTIFYGTFVWLPREPERPATDLLAPKYPLIVKHGALWVNGDGRIEGSDWTVTDEGGLERLIERRGWCVEGTECEGKECVRVVRASEKRNGFFFPGLIGMVFLLLRRRC